MKTQPGAYTAADVREFMGCMRTNHCYACGWQMDRPDGCHPFDCSFKSDDPDYEKARERARKQATMAQAIRATALPDPQTCIVLESPGLSPNGPEKQP